MPVRTLVVFGANGQLGRCLAETPLPEGWRLIGFGHGAADILDPAAVAAALKGIDQGVVVNAAAYTAVDKAESEPDAAFALNRDGAGIVAAAAATAGLPVIHVSTDYVFDGSKTSPWTEDDPVAPLSVYGASKLAGEIAVRGANPRHAILRTSWLFSVHGANFLKTMLRLGAERPLLKVVADQHGCPTAAEDLAAIIVAIASHLAEGQGFGTFHCTGDEPTTWCGFAAAIMDSARKRGRQMAEVQPIPTADYPTPAVRPAYSVLSCLRLAEVHGVAAPPWRRAIEHCLDVLLG
jgi:dTDP-4-dehydrorhamnose reductase